MAGHKKWQELADRFDAAHPELAVGRAERLAAMEVETEAYQRTLREIRKARKLTQVAVAERLETTQANVSQLEARTDLYLSTLAGYVAALGGRLEVTAVFEGERYELKLADLAGDTETNPAAEQAPALSA